jgi:hypothetical protein
MLASHVNYATNLAVRVRRQEEPMNCNPVKAAALAAANISIQSESQYAVGVTVFRPMLFGPR